MLFYSIQVLSTDEESVQQSLFMTSPQSGTKCGGNEVCVTFAIHCAERKCCLGKPSQSVVVIFPPVSPVHILQFATKFIMQNSVKFRLENKCLIEYEDVHDVDINRSLWDYTGCIFF